MFQPILKLDNTIKDVFTLTTSLPDESWCTSVIREVRCNVVSVICPRCQSYNIKNDSHYSSYQSSFATCKRVQ